MAGKTSLSRMCGRCLSVPKGQVHFQSTTSHKSLSLRTCEMGPSVAPLGWVPTSVLAIAGSKYVYPSQVGMPRTDFEKRTLMKANFLRHCSQDKSQTDLGEMDMESELALPWPVGALWRALERYLCSKNKWEKAKPHASITFQKMRSCCPTQQGPGSGPWMGAPLVWAGSTSKCSRGCFRNCTWPDGRGAGPGSGTTAQLGEEEGADGYQVSKGGGSFFFAPADPSHECRPRKNSRKEAWLGSCQVVPLGGRQQPCHLNPGIYY